MYSKKYIALLKEEQTIIEKHKCELVDHWAKISKLRDVCVHKWTYNSDASGGSDSYWSCEHCDCISHKDPHYKQPHELTPKDKKYTIEMLDKKYPQGWKSKLA